MLSYSKYHFHCFNKSLMKCRSDFVARYGHFELDSADVIIVLGGDGMMLTAIRNHFDYGLPIYGINCGSVGFLMNELLIDDLPQRLSTAEISRIHPLIMRLNGRKVFYRAFNEVSFLRQTHQAAKLSISIDGNIRMRELIADGLIVSTAIGSTAYNLSASGPIIPVGNSLLAMTPLSPFRPRHWRGALLPSGVKITIYNHEYKSRPVSATADNIEIRDMKQAEIYEDNKCSVDILFDKGHSLDEKILREQFADSRSGF